MSGFFSLNIMFMRFIQTVWILSIYYYCCKVFHCVNTSLFVCPVSRFGLLLIILFISRISFWFILNLPNFLDSILFCSHVFKFLLCVLEVIYIHLFYILLILLSWRFRPFFFLTLLTMTSFILFCKFWLSFALFFAVCSFWIRCRVGLMLICPEIWVCFC